MMSSNVKHDACESTGWFTRIDLDGVDIYPCDACNPDGMVIAPPEPDDGLRTAIIAGLPDTQYVTITLPSRWLPVFCAASTLITIGLAVVILRALS